MLSHDGGSTGLENNGGPAACSTSPMGDHRLLSKGVATAKTHETPEMSMQEHRECGFKWMKLSQPKPFIRYDSLEAPMAPQAPDGIYIELLLFPILLLKGNAHQHR